MVGYSNQSKAYRILHLHNKEIIIARNVKFDKSVFPGLNKETNDFDFGLMPDSTADTNSPMTGALEFWR
ncbi:hypothetical protein V1508DRAFT_427823 [Lipomyces doorenjongii]|uniref:uncharacterized protein n=1 Tax=Lipomyces doorenjongii TaxID=383834 RepID=UPI0034CFA554